MKCERCDGETMEVAHAPSLFSHEHVEGSDCCVLVPRCSECCDAMGEVGVPLMNLGMIPREGLELAPCPRYVGNMLVVDWPAVKPDYVMLNAEMLSMLMEHAYDFPLVEDHGLEEFFAIPTPKFEKFIADGNQRLNPDLMS